MGRKIAVFKGDFTGSIVLDSVWDSYKMAEDAILELGYIRDTNSHNTYVKSVPNVQKCYVTLELVNYNKLED